MRKFYSEEEAYLKQRKEEIAKEFRNENKRDVVQEEENAEISVTNVKSKRRIKPVEKLNL